MAAFAQNGAYVDLYSTKDFFDANVVGRQHLVFQIPVGGRGKAKELVQTEDGTPTIPGANNNLWVIADTSSQTGIVSGYGNVPLEIHDLNYVLKAGTPGFDLIGGADLNINMTGDLNITLEESYANWNPVNLNIAIGGNSDTQVGNTYHVYGDMNVENKAS